ncbi:bifunctional diaminohydroxyphosphoribosylaminopyrimidine deaminase/5-amino-6-(5-phosphoribosylamino)uracil reductase RibD [Rathayibacter toxicus]|nr:bifunctional diaminohydroxyphosphoribosylaminopyrimidine deaminase/5-amino-6-(5-phosphoribosylamino)uracil reductase RibD [Rathayibacter toxicus]
MTIHYERAMRRALALAARGPARGVNPQVGCVILAPDGTVLAEGTHFGAGTAHAEVNALSQLAPGAASGATAVISLEPCDHTGRTGPCSRALLDAGIARVVYATADPGESSGGGGGTLRAAGVEVIEGVLADEAEEFLRVWLTATRHRRPYVTLKWASTLDGRTAAADGSSRWITGTAARQRVHEQRAANDAIVVGTGTVLADNPALTARGDGGELLADQPLPVVIGAREIPAQAQVRRHPRGMLLERDHDLDGVLARLYAADIRRVYVEGGPRLASALVTTGAVDEYLIYLAPTLCGGPLLALDEIGVTSITDAYRLRFHAVEVLGDDLFVTARPCTFPPGDAATSARLPHTLQRRTR